MSFIDFTMQTHFKRMTIKIKKYNEANKRDQVLTQLPL